MHRRMSQNGGRKTENKRRKFSRTQFDVFLRRCATPDLAEAGDNVSQYALLRQSGFGPATVQNFK